MQPYLAFLALGLAALPSTFAWGAAGHAIVATIAQLHLHPDVLPVLCDVLDSSSSSHLRSSAVDGQIPCHLAPIASWADRVKRDPAYRYTSVLHYINARDDHPPDACAFPGSNGWMGRSGANILGAVKNVTGVLGVYVGSMQGGEVVRTAGGETAGSEALKFLVHYLGDLHMPLHLIGRERGGNGVRITFDGRVATLHSLWDNLLIAQRLRTIPGNYTYPIPGPAGRALEQHLFGAIYDPYIRRIAYEGFGVGLSKGQGRFQDWEDWSDCPATTSEMANSGWLGRAQQVLGSGWRWLTGGEDWDDGKVCPYAWASEIHKMNCEFPIWPRELAFGPALSNAVAETEDTLESQGGRPRPHPDLVELDTPEYAGRLREEWVVERLVALAGVRLATILNGVVLGIWEPVQLRTY